MHHRTALTTLLLLSMAVWPTQLPMAEDAGQETWQMATKGANIQEFVAQVARITGKTFIVDPKLKGQVTVISDTPLGKDGVYALFLSVLRLQNYTAVPSGDVIRIQQSATGKQTPGVLGRPEAAAPEELMTEVIAVQNTASDELLKLYVESGVYNFYVRDDSGAWNNMNYDTGAAEIVFPASDFQRQSPEPM